MAPGSIVAQLRAMAHFHYLRKNFGTYCKKGPRFDSGARHILAQIATECAFPLSISNMFPALPSILHRIMATAGTRSRFTHLKANPTSNADRKLGAKAKYLRRKKLSASKRLSFYFQYFKAGGFQKVAGFGAYCAKGTGSIPASSIY